MRSAAGAVFFFSETPGKFRAGVLCSTSEVRMGSANGCRPKLGLPFVGDVQAARKAMP
jgi:hypothetical protein